MPMIINYKNDVSSSIHKIFQMNLLNKIELCNIRKNLRKVVNNEKKRTKADMPNKWSKIIRGNSVYIRKSRIQRKVISEDKKDIL